MTVLGSTVGIATPATFLKGNEMASPLLVFRIGYMKSYRGFGDISGGGSYIEEHGEGGEMWNFQPDHGYCYGYVMSRHFAGH